MTRILVVEDEPGIALALVTIVTVLRFQSRRLLELLGPHA